MSPERAAETVRNEIVALFMPTCLSSAALVPRAHLFYILLPGASPLRGSAAGLLSYRPLSRAQSTVPVFGFAYAEAGAFARFGIKAF